MDGGHGGHGGHGGYSGYGGYMWLYVAICSYGWIVFSMFFFDF